MILPILSICGTDADQAESLLDLIAAQRNKLPRGFILLAFAWDVHPEMQLKLKISASIGFLNVETFQAIPPEPTPPTKMESVNLFYQQVLRYSGRNYRGPFLMLEPDCVLTKPDAIERIGDGYEAQPKHYLGTIMVDREKKRCIGRVGVYPRSAHIDIGQLFASTSLFEIAAGETLVERTGKTRLIQVLPVLASEDLEKVRSDAVLVHGDKKGLLMAKMREISFQTVERQKDIIPDPTVMGVRNLNGNVAPVLPVRFGNYDGTLMPCPLTNGSVEPNPTWVTPNPDENVPHGTIPKIDGRSRAGRMARLQVNKTGV